MAETVLSALAGALAGGRVRAIDLTQSLSADTPALQLPAEFGQCIGFSSREVSRYDARGVAWYWNEFTMNEHTGTHFDAPVHWVTGKDLPDNAVDTIPANHFVAPAVVIDIVEKCSADPDYLLRVSDILAFEAANGRIAPRSWILLRTDWSKRSTNDYVNRREDGAHTPGPSTEAVRFLIDERDAHGLGVETIGTDAGQAHLLQPAYPAHTLFHAAGRYGLQCLSNLDLLPPTGAIVIAAPLKIAGGSGSPLRVLALVEG